MQYRMHPKISYLPSKLFYEGKLLDGIDAADRDSAMHERVRGALNLGNVLANLLNVS